MLVRFANAEVPAYKLRKGIVVRYDNEFVHIKSFINVCDGTLKLVVESERDVWEVIPIHLTWLET